MLGIRVEVCFCHKVAVHVSRHRACAYLDAIIAMRYTHNTTVLRI